MKPSCCRLFVLLVAIVAVPMNAVAEDALPLRLTAAGGEARPVIGQTHSGLDGNKYGFEGGCAFREGGTYHLFSAEIYDSPFWVSMRLGHWTSPDLKKWTRASTLFTSKGEGHEADSKFSIWAPMPIYNDAEGRWNLFYICYRGPLAEGESTHMDGKVYRAVSTVPGRKGLGGPYEDAGVVLQPDAASQPWEGQQGTDSFFPYRVGKLWYSFYGSHNYHPISLWPVGLARAPALAGPWTRCANNPSPIEPKFIENPIVQKIGRAWVAVYDSSPIEGEATYVCDGRHIGYSASADGVNWPKGRRVQVQTRETGDWSDDIRTPLGLIALDDGRYAMLYTGKVRGSQFWAVGLAYVAVEEDASDD